MPPTYAFVEQDVERLLRELQRDLLALPPPFRRVLCCTAATQQARTSNADPLSVCARSVRVRRRRTDARGFGWSGRRKTSILMSGTWLSRSRSSRCRCCLRWRARSSRARCPSTAAVRVDGARRGVDPFFILVGSRYGVGRPAGPASLDRALCPTAPARATKTTTMLYNDNDMGGAGGPRKKEDMSWTLSGPKRHRASGHPWPSLTSTPLPLPRLCFMGSSRWRGGTRRGRRCGPSGCRWRRRRSPAGTRPGRRCRRSGSQRCLPRWPGRAARLPG